MVGKPPDMAITAYAKERKSGAQVGVGWTQDDGSIALVLNPGTALIYHPNVIYKVKPRNADASSGMPLASEPARPTRFGFSAAPPRNPIKPPSFDDFDDDIPF
jgi:hypothetical protein